MSSGLQEGTIFAGRYKVLRRVAAGGMGAVYEVMHLETDRRRALKVMHAHTLQSEDMRERFKREAKVAAHIESDFIVEVFDAGVDETTQMPFLVMELLRGEDLSKRLKRLGRLPPEEVVLHLHQAALALDKTHKALIIHRDLKPENLFLAEREDSPPRIKVLDFGIAKIVAESATSGGATESIGTPFYMSPEQFNPSARLTGASDIYALGMIGYTLLVGVNYWSDEARAGNIFAVVAVAVHGPPQPASFRARTRGVALPPAFDRWFVQMTAVNPAHRFSTASAAVRALAEVFGVALPMGGSSLAQSGTAEGALHRPALASAPAWVAPPAPAPEEYPDRATIPMQTPSRALLQTPSPAVPPAPRLMANSSPAVPQAPVPWVPQAPASDALPVAGPGVTAPGASMTRPVPPQRGKGGLIAVGLAISALGLSGVVFYIVRSQRVAPTAAIRDQAPVAPPSAPTEAAPPATTPPAAPTSTPGPVDSTATTLPEPVDSAALKVPAQKVADKPAPSPSPGPSPSEPNDPKETGGGSVSGVGILNMNSIPVSKVVLDGKPLGSTPKVGVSAPAGPHTVTFIHPELGKRLVTLQLKPGETKTAAVKFQ